jgi:arabinofuranan 3-O-arabinosyltransferase
MVYRVCGQTSVPLAAGSHVISFAPGGSFQVTGLTAQDQATEATAIATADTPRRTARITSWNPQHRTVAVSAGPATFVQVSQNFSTGWVAKFDGRTLSPVRLDGWQQGWVVPAGAAGTVVMTFGPDSGYRLGLGLGALLLVVLALLAFTGKRRSRLASIGPRAKFPGWALAVVAGIVAVAVGGWLALVLVPLIAVAHRWGGRVVAVVGGVAFVVAGIIVAWDPSIVPALHQGAFSAAAQVASVVALCAILSGVVVEERREFHAPVPVPVPAEAPPE